MGRGCSINRLEKNFELEKLHVSLKCMNSTYSKATARIRRELV